MALVTVTATIPAAGARQGDKIDCIVSSIGSAKSLAGGRLFLTPLIGPDPKHPRVYAFAEGPVTLENPDMPNTGRIHEGCRLEEEFFNAFTKDNHFTLVLDKVPRRFPGRPGHRRADQSARWASKSATTPPSPMPSTRATSSSQIPSQYRDDPVSFISQVLAIADPGAARPCRGW